MARQSLKHMTPEQKAEHKKEQARLRKQKQRERERPAIELKKILRMLEREMEKDLARRKTWPFAKLTDELREFVDELIDLPLEKAALALARYEHQYRQRIWLPRANELSGITHDEAQAVERRFRRFAIIQYFAADAIERMQGRESMKRHKTKEAGEAKELGMSLDDYRAHKRRHRKAA